MGIPFALALGLPLAAPCAEPGVPAPWHHGALYETAPAVETERPLVAPARLALAALDAAPPSVTSTSWVHERSLYSIMPTGTLEAVVSPAEEERVWLRNTVNEADQWMRQRKPDDAIAVMRTALDKALLAENKALLESRLGSYLFRLQRYDEALEHMRAAVKLQPEDYATACNLAAVLMSIGRTDEAYTILSGLDVTQVRSAPLLFSIFFNLSCLNALRGQTDVAIQNLSRAAQADPASTLASLGDPQLDNIRNMDFFTKIKQMLEVRVAPPQNVP